MRLYLQEDQLEYMEEMEIKEIIKKQSEFISFPYNSISPRLSLTSRKEDEESQRG